MGRHDRIQARRMLASVASLSCINTGSGIEARGGEGGLDYEHCTETMVDRAMNAYLNDFENGQSVGRLASVRLIGRAFFLNLSR